MYFYTILIIYILISYLVSFQIRNIKIARIVFFTLLSVGIIAFQGSRSFSVGSDTMTYVLSYPKIGNLDLLEVEYLNFEPGYVILNKLLYFIGVNERVFLFIISALIQIPIIYTICKYSNLPLISIFWYFSFGNFIFTFSGLRQSIAMAFCFFGFKYIKNKKLIKYILIVLLASTFHKSALVCLLLYPLYYINIDRKKMFLVLSVLLLVFIFRRKIIYVLSMIYYGKVHELSNSGGYTLYIIYILMYIISFYPKSCCIDKELVGLRNILMMLTFIYSFASVHSSFPRVGFPLSLYVSLLVPKIILNYKVEPKVIYYMLCYITIMVMVYSLLGGLNTLPYSFG